jgi:hypothetical protein
MRLDSRLRCLHDKTIHSLSLQSFQRILGIIFGGVAPDSHSEWRDGTVHSRGISPTLEGRNEFVRVCPVVVSCYLN